MCIEIMASVPENPELKIKAIMPITWVSMPEIQANVPGNLDQGACYCRQIPETKSGLRCLKSRKMRAVIRARQMPETKSVFLQILG